MSTHTLTPDDVLDIQQARWRIDPARSTVGFEVPHLFGLATVRGEFERYAGTLDLSATPAIELTIDAASVQTGQKQRDKHLRSSDFFDVENHPQVRFFSDTVVLDGSTMDVRGELQAAGASIPLVMEATLRREGDELDLGASAQADHRQLGMTWSPLPGMVRTPSKLTVRARLVRAGDAARRTLPANQSATLGTA